MYGSDRYRPKPAAKMPRQTPPRIATGISKMVPTKSPELAPAAEDVRDNNHTIPTLLSPVTEASNAGTAAAPSQ